MLPGKVVSHTVRQEQSPPTSDVVDQGGANGTNPCDEPSELHTEDAHDGVHNNRRSSETIAMHLSARNTRVQRGGWWGMRWNGSASSSQHQNEYTTTMQRAWWAREGSRAAVARGGAREGVLGVLTLISTGTRPPHTCLGAPASTVFPQEGRPPPTHSRSCRTMMMETCLVGEGNPMNRSVMSSVTAAGTHHLPISRPHNNNKRKENRSAGSARERFARERKPLPPALPTHAQQAHEKEGQEGVHAERGGLKGVPKSRGIARRGQSGQAKTNKKSPTPQQEKNKPHTPTHPQHLLPPTATQDPGQGASRNKKYKRCGCRDGGGGWVCRATTPLRAST
jgi:hypothetical protein